MANSAIYVALAVTGNRGLIIKTFLVLWIIILVYGFIKR